VKKNTFQEGAASKDTIFELFQHNLKEMLEKNDWIRNATLMQVEAIKVIRYHRYWKCRDKAEYRPTDSLDK
jgi:hypothetical protein